MGKIHELSDLLANQIAAGEVIERPASVVKELVENAIDAHANQIDIITTDSGLTSVRVIDDGDGISNDDVEVAFKRHATSKITTRNDLFKIKTLGFRGEALPSISSVADVVIKTATKGENTGTEMEIKGNKVLEKKSFSSRVGTDIVVSQLFFNTPARLKYLKLPQTELAAISDIVCRIALSHTNIAISLTNNGRQILQTAGNGNLQQAVSAVYSVSVARNMIYFKQQDNDFEISGLTTLPKETRSSRKYITILLNGRYIRNNKIMKALVLGYGSKLMVGRYPLSVINIKLDPFLVDVNVHPSKQEVRISKEEQLCNLITNTIATCIGQKNLIQDAVENLNSNKSKRKKPEQLELGKESQYKANKPNQFSADVIAALVGENNIQEPENKHDIKPIIIKNKKQLDSLAVKQWDSKYQPIDTKVSNINDDDKASAYRLNQNSTNHEKRFPSLKYIGQLHGTYLLAESEDGLYIVDQHAAQERVKYEQNRVLIGQVTNNQQNLLVPLVMSFSASDALIITQSLDKLAELGIILEDFGKNTFIIHHHPTWIPDDKLEETIREMIDWFLQDSKLTIAKFREKTAIMMSCKASIKANHHLEDVQAKSILEQLAKCENPFNCPHGRPTIVHFSPKDMQHMFRRIQENHQSERINILE